MPKQTPPKPSLKPRAPRKKVAQTPPFKSGTVAIVGRPNVGKSTLLNVLVKFKLSAVSPKPQTSRYNILGVLNGEGYQAAFVDTPGMPHKTDALNRRLVGEALGAIAEADLVVLLVEPPPPGDVEKRILREIQKDNKPAILGINKVDRVRKEKLLPSINAYSKLFPFKEIMPISASKLDGVNELLRLIVQHLPNGSLLYAEDEITDKSERFLAAELLREQVFNTYAQEIPYAVAVEIDEFVESSQDHGGKDYLKANLYVEKDSQKGILIGRGGDMLKRIGTEARQRIETLLERPVFLELRVDVHPAWRKDRAFLERGGY